MKPFKNKEEELKWEKENCLTVGKLKEYLSKFPDDTLVYILEPNTNSWQSTTHASDVFSEISTVKKTLRNHLKHWFKDSVDKSRKIYREMKETFRYALDKDGICVYL